MKRVLFFSLVCFGFCCFGQWQFYPIEASQETSQPQRAVQSTINADTARFFWDDFSQENITVDSLKVWGSDTVLYWDYEASKNVFISETLAKKAPTYRVATFDGVDANGDFYSEDETRNYGDSLLSAPLDLSGLEDVVLSFYWQAGGNVEAPSTGDLFQLLFRVDSGVWETVWEQDGFNVNDTETFREVLIDFDELLADGDDYYYNGFQFLFRSYGSMNGPFDAWHLDWVYLDSGRESDNSGGYPDGATTAQLTSPFSPYNSIPIHHLLQDTSYIENPTVGLNYIGSNEFQIELNYQLSLSPDFNTLELSDERAFDRLSPQNRDTIVIVGKTDDVSGNQSIENFYFSQQDFSFLESLDSVMLYSKLLIVDPTTVAPTQPGDIPTYLTDSGPSANLIDLRVNDTIQSKHLLHNYYAYDDGTAEYAAGINASNGQVAVAFWLEEPDTLTNIDIYFPQINPSSAGTSLQLRVFSDLENNVIERTQSVRISDDGSSGINTFTRFTFDYPVALPADTFYVGYIQYINDYVAVGLDRSNLEASKYIYQNTNGNWVRNSILEGALMIRPVFDNIEGEFIINDIAEEPQWQLYPNPTNGVFSVEGTYDQVVVIDAAGRVVLSEAAQAHHDFSHLPRGVYIVQLQAKETRKAIKLIKQ